VEPLAKRAPKGPIDLVNDDCRSMGMTTEGLDGVEGAMVTAGIQNMREMWIYWLRSTLLVSGRRGGLD
jgi:hypothetical protein